jgi:predicted GIY-YIG superfamily endonuclease
MYYTYILRSVKNPGAIYIGYTGDLGARIAQHNSLQNNGYTKRYAPWVLETYLAFSEEKDAKRFELYLKSNSGKAFMRKRLISNQFKEDVEKFNNGKKKTKISEA